MARRKLTEAEKLQNKADRINAKATAELPLFAAILPKVSADDVYWHWRRNKAIAAERLAVSVGELGHCLDELTEQMIRRLAREVLSPEDFAGLDDYRYGTYPRTPEYGISHWRNVLSGRTQVVYRWRRVEDKSTSTGFSIEPETAFPPDGWTPPYTWEQLLAMFPPKRWSTDDKPLDFGDEATCGTVCSKH